MKKTYVSFFVFFLSILCFSSFSIATAEDVLPIKRTLSQAIEHDDTFYKKSVDSFSWIYARQGKPSEMAASSSPLISYQLKLIGEADYRVIMRLNGQEVNAEYDSSKRQVIFQTENLTGKQDVSIAIEVYNQIYELTSWSFTVDPEPVDPFENQNLTLLTTIQDETMAQMNHYRTVLSLPNFTSSSALQKAAQAHSNYLSYNNKSGHMQSLSGLGYIGSNPSARGSYFGYTGRVGEGITYEKKTGFLGVDDLMDAPYHRLSIIEPDNDSLGIGYNNRGDIIVNYGAKADAKEEASVVLYPYNTQEDAKTSWYVAENPNPLRFWGLNRIHVGYPISYAYYPESGDEQLIVTDLSLQDSQNRDVPFYDVTPDRDDHAKHHVFLIPKLPLKPDETYSVNVTAFAKDQSNNTRDISKAWSFKTVSDIDIRDVYFTKSQAVNFLHIAYWSGKDPDAIIQMKKNDELYIERKGNQQWTWKPIVAGDYTLTIENPLFNSIKEMTITITPNDRPRYDEDGDWHISLNENIPMPPIPSADNISIEPITNASTEVVGKATPGIMIVMAEKGQVLETVIVSQDGTFTIPLKQPGIGTELQFHEKNSAGDKSDTISIIVLDVIGLDGYTNWTPSQSVSKTKDWTIRFNEEIALTFVNKSNFYVQSNRKIIEDIDIVLNADKKSVTVKAPKSGYEEGSVYFLYIEGSIQSTSGEDLSEGVKFQFTIPTEK